MRYTNRRLLYFTLNALGLDKLFCRLAIVSKPKSYSSVANSIFILLRPLLSSFWLAKRWRCWNHTKFSFSSYYGWWIYRHPNKNNISVCFRYISDGEAIEAFFCLQYRSSLRTLKTMSDAILFLTLVKEHKIPLYKTQHTLHNSTQQMSWVVQCALGERLLPTRPLS